MNCPQCEQPVGADQHAHTECEDPLGAIVGIPVPIAIYCAHCGIFEAVLFDTGRIGNVRGPLSGAKTVARLEKLIPACRNVRRVNA